MPEHDRHHEHPLQAPAQQSPTAPSARAQLLLLLPAWTARARLLPERDCYRGFNVLISTATSIDVSKLFALADAFALDHLGGRLSDLAALLGRSGAFLEQFRTVLAWF